MGIANIIGAITGSGVADATKSVGEVVDKLFTSDDERLSHAEVMARIEQEQDKMQVEINKINAQSGSFFDGGWRPFIGWTCGIAIAYSYVLAPLLHQLFNLQPVVLNTGELLTLLIGMLGMSSTRTFEKIKGVNK